MFIAILVWWLKLDEMIKGALLASATLLVATPLWLVFRQAEWAVVLVCLGAVFAVGGWLRHRSDERWNKELEAIREINLKYGLGEKL